MTTRRVKIDQGAVGIFYAKNDVGAIDRAVQADVAIPIKQGQLFGYIADYDYTEYFFTLADGSDTTPIATDSPVWRERYAPLTAVSITFNGAGVIKYNYAVPNVNYRLVPAGESLIMGRSGIVINMNPANVDITGTDTTTWTAGETLISYQQLSEHTRIGKPSARLITVADDTWVAFEGDVRFDAPLTA